MGLARRDEQAAVVVPVEVEGEGGTVGRRSQAEVVKHDPGGAPEPVLVLGLMALVVQADDGPRLLFGPIALGHLPSQREPAPTVGLDETTSLVAVAIGLDHDDVSDDLGLFDTRNWLGPILFRGGVWSGLPRGEWCRVWRGFDQAGECAVVEQ